MTLEQDMRIKVRQAREEGEAAGYKSGEADGKKEGILENKLVNARRMKAKGYPAEEIAEICELTPEEIAEL